MRAKVQDVELDEGDASRQPPASGSEPARHRRWPWAVAGLVVAGGALVAAQHVLDARHAADLARFDDVPGVVRPLTHDPHPLWTLGTDRWRVVRAGDLLVQAVVTDGTAHIDGLAPATGRVVWSADVAVPPGRYADYGTSADVECRPLPVGGGTADPDDAARVVCVATAATAGGTEGAPAEVVVLDARSGAALARWRTSVALWTLVGDRTVVASGVDDGARRTWTLTAYAPDGAPAWSRTLDWAVPADAVPTGPGFDTTGTALEAGADHVAFDADGHGVVLDAQGSVQRRFDDSPGTGWAFGRTDVLVKGRLSTIDGERGTVPGHVVDGRADAPGVPAVLVLNPPVDDGSAPEVVLGSPQGGGIAAYDARTGRELWHDTGVTKPGALLGGRLYASNGYRLVACDVRTGRRIWARSLRGNEPILFTDGRSLYVGGSDGLVETYALADGAPGPARSTTGLPAARAGAAGGGLTPWNGRLVVTGADGVTTVVG
jgi:hypothetical protein